MIPAKLSLCKYLIMSALYLFLYQKTYNELKFFYSRVSCATIALTLEIGIYSFFNTLCGIVKPKSYRNVQREAREDIN